MSLLRAKLKSGIADEHVALEDQLGILSPSFDRERYIRLLKGFYGFYLSFETLIQETKNTFEAAQFYSEGRMKMPHLAADLTSLGVLISEIDQIPSLPLRHSLFSSDARLWGAVYVLEGSTLGGQVITAKLSDLWGLSAEGGLRFFAGYQEKTGLQWRGLLQQLESLSLETQGEEVLIGAKETFHILKQWLSS